MKSAKEILTSTKKFHIDLSLKRVQLILALLNNPQNSFKSIHIAGTNGKGSTCKIVNDILIENFKNTEKKVGLFTSPHLFSYTERIKINNQNIPDYIFDRLINDIDSFAKKHNIELTEFELICVVALYYFYIKKVDWAVIEVGLGGKYDATNIISPDICAITTIDFDHTDRLGDTIGKIALQKAGIIKQNSKVVISKNNLGYDVIKKVAEQKSAKLILAQYVDYELNLNGAFQKENLALAYTIVKNLDLEVSENTIKQALKKVEWKFRIDFDENKKLLVDSAHNPSGTKVLRQFLDEKFENNEKTFIFGCLKTKNHKEMLDILLKEDDEFYFYEFDYPNALKFEELDEKYKKRAKKLTSKKEVEDILSNKQNLKIVCGSIYMLGSIFK